MSAVSFGSKLLMGQSGMGVFDVVTAVAAANTVVSCRLNACVFGPFVKLVGLHEYVAPLLATPMRLAVAHAGPKEAVIIRSARIRNLHKLQYKSHAKRAFRDFSSPNFKEPP